jgi:hypothetical protein
MKIIHTLTALSVVVAWSACSSPTDVPASRRQDTTQVTHRSDSLLVNPDKIEFGQLMLPFTSTMSVELTNLAPGDTFMITSLELKNGDQGFSVDDSRLPIVLIGTGDVTRTIDVTFAPTQAGIFIDTLCINGSANHCVELTGVAAFPNTQCRVIEFRDVPVGSAIDTVINVTNYGTDLMTITSITISGAEASNFMIVLPTFPVQIAPSETLSFTLRFVPDSRRTFQALMHLATTGGATLVTDYCLTGKGI